MSKKHKKSKSLQHDLDKKQSSEEKNTRLILQESLLTEKKLFPEQFTIRKNYGSEGFDKIMPWLVKKLLPASANGIWFGKSQSFKTFVLVDLACRIATGKQFANLRTGHGLVYIIAAEGSSGISKRIRAWELKNGCIVGHRLMVVPHAVVPTDAKQRNALIADIQEESVRQNVPVAMIVFDTMSQCSNGMSENEAGEVSRYLQACKEIGEPFGATVINIHHTKKDSDEFRGSSAIVSNVDFLISMKRKAKIEHVTSLKLEKMKEASTEFSWALTLEKLNIGVQDEDGEQLNTLCVTEVTLEEQSEGDSCDGSPQQYKVDSEWLFNHLRSKRKASSLADIKEALAISIGVPVDKRITMRVNRAKGLLQTKGKIQSTKVGREVLISVIEDIAA